MLDDAISFPTTADDWKGTALIGGGLNLLGALVFLPLLVVYGYLLRVMRAGATGGSAPSFTDWGDLFVDGVKLFALGLAAVLAAGVPLAVLAGVGGAVAALTGSEAVGGGVLLGAVLVAGGVTLVLGYALPAAVANVAIEDSFGAAFDAETIVDGAFTREYATAWLLAALVWLVGNTIGSLLAVVLVGFVVLFYTQVVTAHLLGRGFAAGLGTTPANGDAPIDR
jgi:hypothetical protein